MGKRYQGAKSFIGTWIPAFNLALAGLLAITTFVQFRSQRDDMEIDNILALMEQVPNVSLYVEKGEKNKIEAIGLFFDELEDYLPWVIDLKPKIVGSAGESVTPKNKEQYSNKSTEAYFTTIESFREDKTTPKYTNTYVVFESWYKKPLPKDFHDTPLSNEYGLFRFNATDDVGNLVYAVTVGPPITGENKGEIDNRLNEARKIHGDAFIWLPKKPWQKGCHLIGKTTEDYSTCN